MPSVTYSIDGFRRNLSESLEELKDAAKQLQEDGRADVEHLEDLAAVIDDLICQSNSFNCVHHPDVSSFSDMSSLEISLLSEDDKEGA